MTRETQDTEVSHFQMLLSVMALIMAAATVVAMLRASQVGVISPWKIGASGFGIAASLLVLRGGLRRVMSRV